MSDRTRWAIVGPGDIARRTVRDIQRVSSIELVGIASRSLDRASAFASEFDIPRSYGSYEALLDDPEIDVIYVAVPHSEHFELSRRALLAGKHVLCEKPFTTTAQDARELAALAADRGLFLMEAMWMRFSPAILKLQELIAAGTIGEPTFASASFGVAFPAEVHRMWDPALAGGALLDLGVYTVTFAQLFLGAPDDIVVHGRAQSNGIDLHETVYLTAGDRVGVAVSSMVAGITPTASIGGPGGAFALDEPFYASSRLSLIEMPSWEKSTFEFELEGAGYTPMFRAVSDAILEGLTEHPLNPLAETIAILETLDEVRRQLQQDADSPDSHSRRADQV